MLAGACFQSVVGNLGHSRQESALQIVNNVSETFVLVPREGICFPMMPQAVALFSVSEQCCTSVIMGAIPLPEIQLYRSFFLLLCTHAK